MNKKIIVENLEQLIEEHKKEKIPYKTYEFDNASYTLLLIDINQLIKQLEEKDKVIDEAIDYIKNTKNYIFDAKRNKITGELIVNNKIETNTINKIKLLEILERGKNGK